MDDATTLFIALRVFFLILLGLVVFAFLQSVRSKKLRIAVGLSFLLSIGVSALTYVIDAWLNRSQFGVVSLLLAPLLNGATFVTAFTVIRVTVPELWEDKSLDTIKLVFGFPSLLVLVELLLSFCLLAEGTVCILMAAPFLWVATVLGAGLAHLVMRYMKPKNQMPVCAALILLTVLSPFAELAENKYASDHLSSHTTSDLIINAPADKIFPYVQAFPLIKESRMERAGDALFAMGLPEPKYATIACADAACEKRVRHCMFTQKTHFEEPVTVYRPPYELTFSVASKVGQQDRLTGVDIHIRPGGYYFDNTQGQFLLIPLSKNKTLVRGTTWYNLNTSLNWYAKPWTDYILHTIHLKVLHHIKRLAEEKSKT